MKTGNCDNYPEIIVRSNDYYQCRYNIKQVEKVFDFDNTNKISYNYEYIKLKKLDDNNIKFSLLENECDENKINDIINTINKYYENVFK
jgi:hypothetical protein